jgi:hypothetical protein
VPLAFLGIVLVAGSASFGANIGYAMNTCPGVFSYTRYVVTATEGSVAAFLSIAAALSLAAGFARRFHLSRLQFTLWVIAVLVVPVASLGLSFGLTRALHCR